MIYFLQTAPGGRIKIGTSICLTTRLRQLDLEHGEAHRVLAVTDGSYTEEKALHDKFASSWIEGEWFNADDNLLAFIETECRPWDGTDEAGEATVISVKMTLQFRDWLAEVADAERSTIVQVLEKGAVEYGKRLGYTDAPKRTRK